MDELTNIYEIKNHDYKISLSFNSFFEHPPPFSSQKISFDVFFSVDFLFSLKWIFLLWIYLLSASIVFQFVVYPIVPCIWIGKTKGRRRGKLWHLFFVIYDNFSQFSTKAPTVITILVSISFNWKYHKKYHPHRNWLMISQFKFKMNRIFHSSIRLTRMNDTSLSNNKKTWVWALN